MRLRQKLTLGFLGMALIVVGVGGLSLNLGQKAILKAIDRGALSLTNKTMDAIDMAIHHRIEQVYVYSQEISRTLLTQNSNREFDKIADIPGFVHAVDADWQSGKETPFIQGILNNELSNKLKEEFQVGDYYEDAYGYVVFPEAFVTNQYGVVIGATGRTTDYWQADEQWYQKGMAEKGFWIGDVAYDKSAGVYACDIIISLYDEQGNFSGIFKAILNLAEIVREIEEIKRNLQDTEHKGHDHALHPNTEFKLVNAESRIIYSTKIHEPFAEAKNDLRTLIETKTEQECASKLYRKSRWPGEKEYLCTYARSKGHRDFKGLGWILVMEQSTEEALADVSRMKSLLLIVIVGLTTPAVLLGIVISKAICAPIVKLKKAALEIGKGNLDTDIEICSNDEVGLLAGAFKEMAKELTVSITDLETEIAGHKHAQEELRQQKQIQEAILEAAPVGILVMYCSTMWLRLM